MSFIRMITLEELPEDCLHIIFYNLDSEDLFNCSFTCSVLQNVCNNFKFLKCWLIERTELDASFFEPFEEEVTLNLIKSYEDYYETGDFDCLIYYKDFMNHLFMKTS